MPTESFQKIHKTQHELVVGTRSSSINLYWSCQRAIVRRLSAIFENTD